VKSEMRLSCRAALTRSFLKALSRLQSISAHELTAVIFRPEKPIFRQKVVQSFLEEVLAKVQFSSDWFNTIQYGSLGLFDIHCFEFQF